MPNENKIGRYDVRQLLGQGNMGCVYLAFDPNLGRDVAIKTIRGQLKHGGGDGSQPFKDRFFREARTNSHLNHPNIVSVFDSGLHDNDPFLVMEYIDGAPLERLIAGGKINDLLIKHRLLTQIASALDYAHKRGVIHRDIKPSNILVTREMDAKIVDFGLAKLKDTAITTTGVFLGTPSYASPEQILTGKIDNRSDLFSFGVLAYELLTGTRPFPGDNLNSILYHVVHSTPDLSFEPLSLDGQLARLQEIFSKMLQKEPDKRYQNASDFVVDVENCLGLEHLPEKERSLPTDSLVHVKNWSAQVDEALGSAGRVGLDETLLLENALPAEWVKKRWVSIAAIGGMALLILALALNWANESGNGEAPADQTETQVFLNPTKIARTESMLEAGQKVHIDLLQDKYVEEILAKRIEDAEATLANLRRLGVDLESNKQLLESARRQSKDKASARVDARNKKKLETRFLNAQKEGKPEEMAGVLEDYAARWPREKNTLETWRLMLEQERQAWRERVEQERGLFESALREREPGLAERYWRHLRDLGAAEEADGRALENLQRTTHINGLHMKFVKIPAGSFRMGPKPEVPGVEDKRGLVTLTTDFFMGMYEVTQAQWVALMGNNPSKVKGDQLPVTNVSWVECQAFVEALNNMEGGNWYRLPTEAEWEYACRVGGEQPFSSGDRLHGNLANFEESKILRPVPVGGYPANAWGLHDMHGNVAEWCRDVYASLPEADREDPVVEKDSLWDRRVVRGGSFDSKETQCAATIRDRRRSGSPARQVGFRLVRASRVEDPAPEQTP